MSDPSKKEEKKKSGLAWWFSRAKGAGALARGGAAGSVVGAGGGGSSAAAAAAAANAATMKAVAAMVMGALAIGGMAVSDHMKHKNDRKPAAAARRFFDDHSMDKPKGELQGDGKPYSSLGMVSIGDMSRKGAPEEAAKAQDEAAATQAGGGAEGAAAQSGDQIAQAMAAAQAQTQGAALGNAGSGRAAKLPGGNGVGFGKDAAGGGSSGAHFGDAAGGRSGPAARSDNGAGKISSFAAGGAQTSRTGALVSQRTNRARGFSARQLASVSNDASNARSFIKGGGMTETSAAAAGRSFDGASLGGQAITGAGGGVGGQGAAGGAGAVALGGGGGGGGGKDTTPGPNNCPAGTSWSAASSACMPVADDTSDECDAEVGQQSTAEGWRKGMEDGHVSVRDHRDSSLSLAGAAGCSKNKGYIVRDHRNHQHDDPDQIWIDRAQKILAAAAALAAMQMTLSYFMFWGTLAMLIMGCGSALTTIGMKFMVEGRYMLGAIWMAIGSAVSALAWTGSKDLKGKAKTVADTVSGGDYSSGTPDPVPSQSRDHRN